MDRLTDSIRSGIGFYAVCAVCFVAVVVDLWRVA